jgi:DtxR family Mn-dependent transcriptional regulator
MFTLAEENYLKAILKLSKNSKDSVSTNAIAQELNTKASSVTEMVKKLTKKKLVNHQPYFGVSLTKSGYSTAIEIIRKHRLWEVFLVNKLKFQWDEVHEVAEQLEHVKSKKLIDLLDSFLGFPQHDPHGEPIPDKDGVFPKLFSIPLSELEVSKQGNVIGVSQDNPDFLKYLNTLKINIGTNIKVIKKIIFDGSLEIKINNTKAHVSSEVAKNILIKQKQ